jgi:NitT/TauT family transport system substrate-binding protein
MRRRDLLRSSLALTLAGAAAATPAAAVVVPDLQLLAAPGPPSIVLARLLDSGALRQAAPDATFRTWRDPDELRAGIASGRTRLFTTPSHVPALFASRGLPIRLLAVISMGQLAVVADDPSLSSIAGLRGRSVTAFFRDDMPDFVFRALLRREGLEPGRDLTLTYVATAMEAAQLAIAGRASVAMLAEPLATMAVDKAAASGRGLHRSFSLRAEWGRLFGRPRIPMAGLALHQSLIDASPELLAVLRAGLPEAAAWVQAEPFAAGVLAEQRLAIPAPLFRKALPHCSIEVQGARAMQAELLDFYRELGDLHPAAVGGQMPDDAFFLDL